MSGEEYCRWREQPVQRHRGWIKPDVFKEWPGDWGEDGEVTGQVAQGPAGFHLE